MDADYRTPMQNSLLWVYEGQTQFWGYVLGALGHAVEQDTLDAIAYRSRLQHRHAGPQLAPAGRHHQRSDHRRPHTDPVAQPAAFGGLLQRRPADLARCRPHASPNVGRKRSIDDFAAAFFGIRDRDWGEVTYTLDDVVRPSTASSTIGAATCSARLRRAPGPVEGIN